MDNDIQKNKTKKKFSIVTKIFLILSLTLCVCALLYYFSLKINHGIFDGDLERIRGPHLFVSFIAEISLNAGMICYGICLLFFLIPLIHPFFSGAILKNLIATLGGIVIAFSSAALLMGTFESWRSSSIRWSSRSIDDIYGAIHKYSEKHDGFLPPLNQWYVTLAQSDPNNFVLPSNTKGDTSIGYGINLNLEGYRLKEIPPNVIFIFGTNPFEYGTSYENKLSSVKHNGKGCVVLFGDLHLEFIKTQDFNKVRWQP